MRSLALFALFITNIFAYDSYVDLQFTVDPFDLRGQSHMDITAPHVIYHEGGSVIITPEATTYMNSNVDLGFSVAKKHELWGHVLGAHVFYDRSSLSGNSFHQVGMGAIVSSDKFDVTANYYYPISSASYDSGTAINPCRWIDAETLFKTPYFNIGTGPIYNIDYKSFALHSRLVIPTDRCQFSIGGLIGEGGFSHAFLSLSFSLMKNPGSGSLSTPINRTKKCSVAFYSSSPKNSEKLGKYIDQIESDISVPKNQSSSPAALPQ